MVKNCAKCYEYTDNNLKIHMRNLNGFIAAKDVREGNPEIATINGICVVLQFVRGGYGVYAGRNSVEQSSILFAQIIRSRSIETAHNMFNKTVVYVRNTSSVPINADDVLSYMCTLKQRTEKEETNGWRLYLA